MWCYVHKCVATHPTLTSLTDNHKLININQAYNVQFVCPQTVVCVQK